MSFIREGRGRYRGLADATVEAAILRVNSCLILPMAYAAPSSVNSLVAAQFHPES